MASDQAKRKAIQIILLFGLVSLCGDLVYEAARSVNGPYLKILAANAAIVGLIAGAGEFLGYALRLVSGYFSDKIKAYWLFIFLGYGLIIAVPMLSLAGIWQVAAVFILFERIGKAIRSPARDTVLSSAASQVGTGWGFGLHEALDQIGAVAGPLIFVFVLALSKNNHQDILVYQAGYRLLWIPFVMMMVCLVLARAKLARAQQLEAASPVNQEEKLSRVFWLYAFFSFAATTGFANFVLIGYHFKTIGLFHDSWIPLFYALAMALDAVAALSIGKIYDVLKIRRKDHRAGLDTLIIIPVLSIFIPVCAFSHNPFLGVAGVAIWGIVMGAHETIMRSSIADITPLKKRGMGYGIFNSLYGLAMLIGGALTGLLYEHSLVWLIAFSVIAELAAAALFFMLRREACGPIR